MNRPSRTDDTSRFDTPHFVAQREALRTSNSMKPADLWSKSHHHASASSTASLMGNSQQRPRITRKAAPVTAMARVRKAIRGVSALSNWYELRSVFHRDGSIGSSDVVADLSVEAFWLRLRDLGCSDDDIAEVAGSFDPTRCGSMSTKDLFAVLTSPMWRIDPSIKVTVCCTARKHGRLSCSEIATSPPPSHLTPHPPHHTHTHTHTTATRVRQGARGDAHARALWSRLPP